MCFGDLGITLDEQLTDTSQGVQSVCMFVFFHERKYLASVVRYDGIFGLAG